MIFRYGLLFPAILVALLLVGSVSAGAIPVIPSPPYIPKSPQEDIVTVETYVVGTQVWVTVNFAAATPPPGQTLWILITSTQVYPPTETVVSWDKFISPAVQEYSFFINKWTQETPSVAVYAWVGGPGTERAPNDGFYSITSLSAQNPNVFQDPEGPPVGGVVIPTNKLGIVAPFAALAGLAAVVSTVVLVKRRRD